jgi:drug/metabolite transporter (DMT)-like permease
MWIIYSLLTALSLATCDALTKRALESKNEYFITWAKLLFACPFFLLFLIIVKVPPLDMTFWVAALTAVPLEIIALILYTRSLKVSPISLTMPFLALTPVFLIVTSYLIVGERVSFFGGIGISFIAIGSYTLHFHKMKHTVLEPVRAIFRERGTVLIIVVAAIYSITASLGKLAIEHSSPLFFGSFYFVLVTICFTPIAYAKTNGKLRFTRKVVPVLAPIGATYALMIIFHMTAMSLSNVAYMIAIKRTSLLFSVLYGHFLFKEEKIAERILGVAIMLVGFVFIVSGF